MNKAKRSCFAPTGRPAGLKYLHGLLDRNMLAVPYQRRPNKTGSGCSTNRVGLDPKV